MINNKSEYQPTHPLQNKEWKQFREKTGIKTVETGGLLIFIHPVPFIGKYIGYIPKGPMPTKEMVDEIRTIGEKENCIFMQFEPNIENNPDLKIKLKNLKLFPSVHPLFTKYTFVLDLTKSEDELLKNMSQKTRYNIKIAQKNGVEIVEDDSLAAFEKYLELTKETTNRKGFYSHTNNYHRLMWETLNNKSFDKNKLTAHLLVAKYKSEILVTWILFVLKDTLYYPYGASSSSFKEVMASNLMMWEAIRFGKKIGLKRFDMWGSLGPNPNTKDPWFGFHRFKQGYGGKLVEFLGSYDLVIDKKYYLLYKMADKFRYLLLKIK